MIETVPVQDRDDPRLADYVSLRDGSLRRHLESERGLFIAEGEKVIRRAVETGARPRSFLLAERWLAGLADIVDRHPDAPVYVVSEDLAEQVTGFHVHRGALASLHRPDPTPMEALGSLERLVVLEDVVDHANVGAILRSAAGLGWSGALLSPRCADPLYRRAVKTSMGAVFALPWARAGDWGRVVPWLRASGYLVVALALSADAVPIHRLAAELTVRPRRLAVLLGTEGNGLSSRWRDEAELVVTIPMSAGHAVDSLNVAAAAAVACYALGPSIAAPADSDAPTDSPRPSLGWTGQSSG